MIVQATSTLAEQLWTILVSLILIAWFIASVIHQFRFRWWSRVSRFDAFSLLPRWSFFAPNPGRHDFHVVYRDFVDDEHGPWVELVVSTVDTRYRWLWNPSRYPYKAISDLTNGLHYELQSSNAEMQMVMLSSSYIGLLNVVIAQPPIGVKASHRQFAIFRTHGFRSDRQIEVAFVSEVHRVGV
jgi:hypothetical protein